MKVVILSGAGLSVPSGLPTYEDIKGTVEYKSFQTADESELLEIIENVNQKYKAFTPNSAHFECKYLETYCESIGVKFQHYTLNIDDLIEKSGGSATHIHGSIAEPSSIVSFKDVPSEDLCCMEWGPSDILIVLGVSNNGFPLAAIEANVLLAGARFLNYNIVSNHETSTETIIGDISETFKFLDHKNLPQVEFIEVDLGFIVSQLECNIMGSEYTVYILPSTEGDFSYERLEGTESRIGMELDENCYEIKFDLKSNIENETVFKLAEVPITRQQLNLLGRVISGLILSHSIDNQVTAYTASAADEKLVVFYNLLASRYVDQLEYVSWCGFGTEGVDYAFKKK
jgi:hypothetical protein